MTIRALLRGKTYVFETKPGLFSKNEIDPGTRLLIEVMEVRPTDIVVDLGCGYGPIGVVAADLANQGKVYMVDTDIRAVKYSKINAQLNHIDYVQIIASDGFEELSDIQFDVVVSNPPSHLPKETLLEFISGAKKHLNIGGKFSVVTERRIKPLIERELEKTFGNFQIVARNSQHVVSLAIK